MGVIRTSSGQFAGYRLSGRDWWLHENVPAIAQQIDQLRGVDGEGFRYGKRRFQAELALPPDTVNADRVALHILRALVLSNPQARRETVMDEVPPFDYDAYARNRRFAGQAVLVDGFGRVVGYRFGDQEFGLSRLNLERASNLWHLARQRGMDSGHTAFEAQCLAEETGLDLEKLGAWAPLDMAWNLVWHADWRSRQKGFAAGYGPAERASTVPLPANGVSLESRIRRVREATASHVVRAQAAVRAATVHARFAAGTAARLQKCDTSCECLVGLIVDAVRSTELSCREARSAADSVFEAVRMAEGLSRVTRVSSAVDAAERHALAVEASAIAAEEYLEEARRARHTLAQLAVHLEAESA